MSQIDSKYRVNSVIPSQSTWLSTSSQFDSCILQLLGIPGRILAPPVTQFFRSKWLHFSFSVTKYCCCREFSYFTNKLCKCNIKLCICLAFSVRNAAACSTICCVTKSFFFLQLFYSYSVALLHLQKKKMIFFYLVCCVLFVL